MQVELQIGARRAERLRAVPVLREQEEGEVADGVVDAGAVLEIRALRVDIEALRQIGVDRGTGREIGKQAGGLRDRGGHDPAMVRGVEAPVKHAGGRMMREAL